MHLNIKNDEAHRLAKELAGLTGTSMTEAVIDALEKRVGEERRSRIEARGDFAARIRTIQKRVRSRPVLDDRPGDEMLYDAGGLPQ